MYLRANHYDLVSILWIGHINLKLTLVQTNRSKRNKLVSKNDPSSYDTTPSLSPPPPKRKIRVSALISSGLKKDGIRWFNIWTLRFNTVIVKICTLWQRTAFACWCNNTFELVKEKSSIIKIANLIINTKGIPRSRKFVWTFLASPFCVRGA